MQNVLADGSSWDGKSDLPMDETTFEQMMSDAEPKRRCREREPASRAAEARRVRTAPERWLRRSGAVAAQWLQLMLAEIARKQEDLERARAESRPPRARRRRSRRCRCAARAQHPASAR